MVYGIRALLLPRSGAGGASTRSSTAQRGRGQQHELLDRHSVLFRDPGHRHAVHQRVQQAEQQGVRPWSPASVLSRTELIHSGIQALQAAAGMCWAGAPCPAAATQRAPQRIPTCCPRPCLLARAGCSMSWRSRRSCSAGSCERAAPERAGAADPGRRALQVRAAACDRTRPDSACSGAHTMLPLLPINNRWSIVYLAHMNPLIQPAGK